MTEKEAEEWAAYLQSKEFRRDARRLTWPIAIGLGAGPGNFAWACLAGILGFKVWDKVVAPEVQKDRETFKAARCDAQDHQL